ncbi:MAG: OsmC family protein [Lautropia sp.]|nr:OsmC family protein [Lautropia sp.]
MKQHRYQSTVEWTGNRGSGTSSYTAYSRDFIATIPGKPVLPGSADPAFRGNASRWNPEDMLLAATSACHKLWYLHLCAVNRITVLSYTDHAEATMDEGDAQHAGRFVSITLHPHVQISADSDADKARALHHDAHAACFIANSLQVPIHCHPTIERHPDS